MQILLSDKSFYGKNYCFSLQTQEFKALLVKGVKKPNCRKCKAKGISHLELRCGQIHKEGKDREGYWKSLLEVIDNEWIFNI